MPNLIDFQDFSHPTKEPGLLDCWLCQKRVSPRALFCSHCGSLQPVRALDHFARLGLEKRVDLDLSELDRRFTAMCLHIEPSRFANRGMVERANAEKHTAAFTEAYETLRDPIRRGRYWMELHGFDLDKPCVPSENLDSFRQELDAMRTPHECDILARRAGEALQVGIVTLLQSLREHTLDRAHTLLAELDGLEEILLAAQARRADLDLID